MSNHNFTFCAGQCVRIRLRRTHGNSTTTDPPSTTDMRTEAYRDTLSTITSSGLIEAHMRRAAPGLSSITPVASHGLTREGGDPPKGRSDVPTARRAIDMSRAVFSASRPVIHSSIESIRRASKAHHRARTAEIICNGEEQNHLQTNGVKGIWGNSRPCDTALSSHYWGRRRYGPVPQAFETA